jgi:hypothetical protein
MIYGCSGVILLYGVHHCLVIVGSPEYLNS